MLLYFTGHTNMLGVVGMMVFQQVGRFIESVIEFYMCRVPRRTGKPGKMGRHFPVREFLTDWKSQGKSHTILENSVNFRQMLLFIFSDI